MTLHERKGRGRVNPIKRGRACICSTYSKQILIYGRVIKLALNLPTAPPHNYIHRACVKRAYDLASSAWEGVCVRRHVKEKRGTDTCMSKYLRVMTRFFWKV